MLTEEFKSALIHTFPLITTDEKGQYLTISTDSCQSHELLGYLKNEADPQFEKLGCLSGVDWPDYMEIVYHLDAIHTNDTIVVKAKISDHINPVIDSITDLWKGAELLECEVYDFFGIGFNNHPFLRRLFLNEDWIGFPLRKDYVDEINMIKL
jgi:NADH:ubiquinone oxidoreductase subunit C